MPKCRIINVLFRPPQDSSPSPPLDKSYHQKQRWLCLVNQDLLATSAKIKIQPVKEPLKMPSKRRFVQVTILGRF